MQAREARYEEARPLTTMGIRARLSEPPATRLARPLLRWHERMTPRSWAWELFGNVPWSHRLRSAPISDVACFLAANEKLATDTGEDIQTVGLPLV